MSEYLLYTNSLTKTFKNHNAVNCIDIHIKKGAIYGLIGRNGAGKTTLLKMISGLSKPTSGQIHIFAKNVNELANLSKQIGCHIEAPGLYPEMTAYQNLKCKCIQRNINNTAYIKELLELVGLDSAGNKKTGKFSLGMKQRLGIAMALVGNPDLLVLDEPINGLDPQGIREVREILIKLNRERGITIIVSSHILDELAKIATDYGIIHNGELVREIAVNDLMEQCKEKIMIKTQNPEKAAAVLDKLKIDSYSVVDDNSIEIFGYISESAHINSELVNAGCKISEITIQSDSLEDYYLKLTGGVQNV
ncbi:MAG: ATP-binding cassette domain-containing protein [Ruminococcus sp.]|nr:ATP-binding cassette domain-containing protein [Ruminococcus sp.]